MISVANNKGADQLCNHCAAELFLFTSTKINLVVLSPDYTCL